MNMCEPNCDPTCGNVEEGYQQVPTREIMATGADVFDNKIVETEQNNNQDNTNLEAIKGRIHEIDAQAAKINDLESRTRIVIGNMEAAVSRPTSSPRSSTSIESLSDKIERDSRSIYVGNVDYGATVDLLKDHFNGCGSVQAVTILRNKFDGRPKGCAYLEFTDLKSVDIAMALDESLFRGRLIKVMPKRTNQPGLCRDRPPRSVGPISSNFGNSRPGTIRGSSRGFSRGGRVFRGYSRSPRQSIGRGSNTYAPY